MKTVLIVGVALLLASVAAPSASAMSSICGHGSVVNRVQHCGNGAIDDTQAIGDNTIDRLQHLICRLACP